MATSTSYLLSDLLYRSTALTDDSGAIEEAYDTDAYGNTQTYSAAGTGGNWFADDAVTTDQPECETIFTGRQYDPESQIYFYRARYYHPILGRFISRDPAGYGAGINLFEYVKGRPSIRFDATGREDSKCDKCDSDKEKAEKAEKQQEKLQKFLDLLEQIKDLVNEKIKAPDPEKAALEKRIEKLEDAAKDIGTDLGMESVQSMVAGIDAFAHSKDCANWYKTTMQDLHDAAAGKFHGDCHQINGGLNDNAPYNNCISDVDAGAAGGLSAGAAGAWLGFIAGKAADACECAQKISAASGKK